MRIAMWSGPRNISTAMMYAFASRPDTAVVDEPFYATYLSRTGLAHPMRKEIIASQSTDPDEVINDLLGPIPGRHSNFYQKHMTQHMTEGVSRDWIRSVRNVFLIRHPARVVASFSAKYENPTIDDLGFVQQLDLFNLARENGAAPLVIDSTDIRRDPEAMLKRLCAALGLPWDDRMLRWAAGGIPEDGVWAPHWYGAVHASTRFAEPEGDLPGLTGKLGDLVEETMSSFEALYRYRL